MFDSQTLNTLIDKSKCFISEYSILSLFVSDPDPPSDRGGPLAALLSRRGSFLPPAARGLLPGRSGQTQEDLRLEPQTWQPRPPNCQHHPVPAAEAAPGMLPSAGREGGVPASAEKVDDTCVSVFSRRSQGETRGLYLKAAVPVN